MMGLLDRLGLLPRRSRAGRIPVDLEAVDAAIDAELAPRYSPNAPAQMIAAIEEIERSSEPIVYGIPVGDVTLAEALPGVEFTIRKPRPPATWAEPRARFLEHLEPELVDDRLPDPDAGGYAELVRRSRR